MWGEIYLPLLAAEPGETRLDGPVIGTLFGTTLSCVGFRSASAPATTTKAWTLSGIRAAVAPTLRRETCCRAELGRGYGGIAGRGFFMLIEIGGEEIEPRPALCFSDTRADDLLTLLIQFPVQFSRSSKAWCSRSAVGDVGPPVVDQFGHRRVGMGASYQREC